MSNTDLRLYDYFVKLCEEKSFSRAAERLNISPSTLTHQIQKLEHQLGVRLVSRQTKSLVRLTDAGVRFYESAIGILHQTTQAELMVRKVARGEIGRVNLGYLVTTAWGGFTPTILAEFQRVKPGIEISIRGMATIGILNAIVGNEIDVGIMSPPDRYPPGLEAHTIYRHHLVLAVPANHRLAHGRQPIKCATLKDEAFVVATIESELGVRRLTDAVTELGGFVAKVARRAPEMTSILAYVAAGFGIAVVPHTVSAVKLRSVAFREFEGASQKPYPSVFVRRSNETSPATLAFIDFVHDLKLKTDQEGNP
jgi:DNA-binding transcriptional LysR family regulator